MVPEWHHKLEPGREHAGPDGGKIVATDRELIHIGSNGSIIRSEPNGESRYRWVAPPQPTLRVGPSPVPANWLRFGAPRTPFLCLLLVYLRRPKEAHAGVIAIREFNAR
jgi:hypothetical protein